MKLISNLFSIIANKSTQISVQSLIRRNLTISSQLLTFQYKPDSFKPYPEPKRWPEKNLVVYPPQELDETPNIRIRGMTIDEAIKQLSFIPKKGAQIVKEILLEAQEIAVREQNFEYKSNIWIGESFVTKGYVVKGLRKHARMRFGEVRYFHCHYFVRLVEGLPPKDYYGNNKTGNEKLKEYIENLRTRRIEFGL